MDAVATYSILVVDDDPAMLDVMSDRLRLAGHDVLPAGSASEARALVRQHKPDLIVLDLILPDADGLVLCQALHERIGVPIVVVSGTQRRNDRLIAFRVGADDFITKPFDLDEFEARVGARLRGSPKTTAAAPGTGRSLYGLDPARQAVRVGEEVIALTPTEYRILEALAIRPGELVRHEEIAASVWGRRIEELGRALDTQARRLRKKLAELPRAPRVVKRHGRGYALVPPGGAAEDEPGTALGEAPAGG